VNQNSKKKKKDQRQRFLQHPVLSLRTPDRDEPLNTKTLRVCCMAKAVRLACLSKQKNDARLGRVVATHRAAFPAWLQKRRQILILPVRGFFRTRPPASGWPKPEA
jgi:hypothetical protein